MENNITLARNETGRFEIFIKTDSNGDFVIPDAVPTFKIYSPTDVELTSGVSISSSKGIYVASWKIPVSLIASDAYYIDWAVIVNGISHSVKEYFTVVVSKGYSGYVSTQSNIIIAEKYMNQIKACVGYPLKDNIILDDNQIKDLCIERALKRYFIKFPIEELYDFISSGTVTDVPFPDDDTFGILDIGIVNKGFAGDLATNGFWSIYASNNLYSSNRLGAIKKYKTDYQFSMDGFGENEARLNVLGSYFNKGTVNYNVDMKNKKVTVYSEIIGTCQIKWAKMSNNFDHVNYEQIDNVIMLSQAYLLEHLADTSGITETSDDEKFNSDALKEKAQTRFETVKTLWDAIPDIIVIN